MANQQSSKGPSLIGQTIGPTAPVVAGEDNTGLVKPLQLDASGNLKVAVTGAGSGGTSSVDEAAFTAGVTAGTPAMGAYQATPSQLTDGQLGILAVDEDRNLKVNVVTGGGSNASVGATGAAVPTSATLVGVSDPSGDLEGLAAETFDYDTGAGTVLVTALGIALPASGGPVAGGTATNPIQVGDAGSSLTVDGPLTDAELRATPVPVSGTVSTGGLTDAELRATPVPISGTVTANSGTNLNTSLLALEAGGNLAAAVTALQIIDDWDESDRAKVNLIVGQAGIAAGTGVDGATVPRVTLATNVPLPAGTNGIGKLTANSGVDIGDVDVTSISAGTNLIGDVGIQPRTTNGLDTMNATSSDGATALTNAAQVIKASAGKLYGYYIYNPNSSAQFVQFYNTAALSVTVGTTNPLFMLTIPATSAANLFSDIGITFSNAGWSWSATSTAGGNGAPPTALDAVAWYK